MANQKLGYFIVSYQIGREMPGAPLLTLHLGVNAVSKNMTGDGSITQATNPPLDLKTEVRGDFTYMATTTDTHILVTATGYASVKWPPQGGIGPALPPNFHLRMVLTKDWKSGTANYEYLGDNGWVPLDNQPVKVIDTPSIAAA